MENKEVYYLCERIKLFHFCTVWSIDWNNGSPKVSELQRKTGKTSDINMFIAGHDWNNLFKNEEWLQLLEDVQNYNCLNPLVTKELRRLSELFPKETELHIVVEALPD